MKKWFGASSNHTILVVDEGSYLVTSLIWLGLAFLGLEMPHFFYYVGLARLA